MGEQTGTRFTPGPWSYTGPHRDGRGRAQGYSINGYAGGIGSPVGVAAVGRAATEPDAALIADAPAMLEALRGLLKVARFGDYSSHTVRRKAHERAEAILQRHGVEV